MFDILRFNTAWMSYNLLLAIMPVFLGWIFYEVRPRYLKAVFFFLWLIFAPNTIYVFTDYLHFIEDLRRVDVLGTIVLNLQYCTLFLGGLITFVAAMMPIDKKLQRLKIFKVEIKANIIVILLNFIIGFGVVVGRVHRLNSWDIFAVPKLFLESIWLTISNLELLILVLLFGFFANFLYFLYKPIFLKFWGKYGPI